MMLKIYILIILIIAMLRSLKATGAVFVKRFAEGCNIPTAILVLGFLDTMALVCGVGWFVIGWF